KVLKIALGRRYIAASVSPLSCRSRVERTTRSPLTNKQQNYVIRDRPVSPLIKTTTESEELSTLFAKLREIIPSSNCNQTSDPNLDVVLGAVDYIRELHVMIQQKIKQTDSPADATK
uniref:Uncharacterized protein n=2 Tax=Ciona intestinalis TaxID=7719 RepID=H2Y109_CIOIN